MDGGGPRVRPRGGSVAPLGRRAPRPQTLRRRAHRCHGADELTSPPPRYRTPPLHHPSSLRHHAREQHPVHDRGPDSARPRRGDRAAARGAGLGPGRGPRGLRSARARRSARTQPHEAGAARLRHVLGEHYAGSTPTWSEFEERFLAFARTAGLPQPEVNFWIVLPDGEPAIRADFAWPAQRVVVETDGRDTHDTRQAFERDRRKDLRLARANWRPMRVTWLRLKAEPALIEGTARALLGL